MSQLVIAVDCDDVLVPSTDRIVSMYNSQYGTAVQSRDAHTSGHPGWAAPKDVARQRIFDIQLSDEYATTPPFIDAIEACRELAKEHELHLVTARPDAIMSVTIDMLSKYFSGVFAEVEHVGLDGDKGEACRRLGASMLIDDNLKHLESARAQGLGGLLWFGDYAWNQLDAPPEGVRRCLNWQIVKQEVDSFAIARL